MRVLVAEDDDAMLDAVAASIELTGAEVVRVGSGGELIEALAEGPAYDLIVTDVAMPWMSGLQAALAARNAGVRTPIIVMTALRDERVTRLVRTLGDRAVLLPKPFELSELQELVIKMSPGRAPT
jgi:CheY-like chemotaxis protein